MKKIDTLVVGQGIAGSLAAYMLYRHKVPFAVIDPGLQNTASRVAAGMFTPVSGKRNTIHPQVSEQIDFSIQIFRELEQLLDTSFLHLKNIYQYHDSELTKKELDKKIKEGSFENYILAPVTPSTDVKQDWGAFEITQSGWVNCKTFIEGFTRWLKQEDALVQQEFIHDDLQVKSDRLEYQGMEFQHIMFCEGYRAVRNPFFSNEKIIPCKGDLLTIRYDHLGDNHIIKKNGIYLIPAGEAMFRVGATYDWNNDQQEPDESAKRILEDRLQGILKDAYTVTSHDSGIRPTTVNREVIAKQHPHHKSMFMLNGLGTKGILQGPWWAKFLTELLISSGNQTATSNLWELPA